MAFQKTGGRKAFVSPTGIGDFSGFKRAAQIYDNVGRDIYDIGTLQRNAQLSDLILQAEASGTTAASTYDKDFNIVPLRSFEVSDLLKSQAVDKADQEKIESAYRQAAIKTYQSSIALQAKKNAQLALEQFPDQPEQIVANMKGMIEGLELPPEIAPYVLPNIIAEYASVEGQAKAERLRVSNKVKESVAKESINNDFMKIAQISANLAGLPPEEQTQAELMISDLRKSIEGSYQSLETVGYQREVQIAALEKAGNAMIATRMAVAHVERKFALTGSMLEAMREIELVYQDVRDDPNIDADGLRTAMTTRLGVLQQIKNEQLNENQKRQGLLYTETLLDMKLGKVIDTNQILSLDISDGQKVALLDFASGVASQIQNRKSEADRKTKDANTENFESLMLKIEDPNTPDSVAQEAAFQIQKMWSEPSTGIPISASQYSKMTTAMSKRTVAGIKASGDAYMADVDLAIAENRMTTQDLINETPSLIRKGYIGNKDKGAIYTLQQWSKKIVELDKRTNQSVKEGNEISASLTRVREGTASESDHEKIAGTQNFQLEIGADNLMFGTSDVAVRESNFEKVTKYALAYNTLPPDAIKFLKTINTGNWSDKSNEQIFNSAVMLFDKIFNSVATGVSSDGTSDVAMGDVYATSLMESMGIDTLSYYKARTLGHQKYYDQMASMSVKGRRALADVESKLGMSLQDKVATSFSKATTQDRLGFFARHFNFLSTSSERRIEHTFQTLEGQLGLFGDLGNVQLNDPLFILAIAGEMQSLIATGRVDLDDEGSFEQGLKVAAHNIGDSIGINIDSNDVAYWSLAPWTNDAAQEIGDNPLPIGKFGSEMSVQEAVYFDIRESMKRMSGLSQEVVRLLEDEDTILRLIPEPLIGAEQTYMVQVQDPDTSMSVNVKGGYRFRWETSVLGPVAKLAEQRVKNSGLKQFFSGLNFLNRNFLQSEMTYIIRDMQNDMSIFSHRSEGRDEFLTSFTNALKRTYNVAFPYEDFEISPDYDKEDVQILQAFLYSLMNDGGFTMSQYLDQIEGFYE